MFWEYKKVTLTFWISSGFWENDSLEKDCGRKSTSRKRTKKWYSIFMWQDGSNTSMVMRGFYQLFAYIMQAPEVIAHEMHLEKYPDWRVWNTTSQNCSSACLSIFDGYFLSHIWSSSYKIHEYNSTQQIIKCYLGSRWPSHLKYLLGIRFEEDWFSNQKTNLFFNIGLSFAHHF